MAGECHDYGIVVVSIGPGKFGLYHEVEQEKDCESD